MITHKHFKNWTVEGNLSWQNEILDDREAQLRDTNEETFEQELLRTNPIAWKVVVK